MNESVTRPQYFNCSTRLKDFYPATYLNFNKLLEKLQVLFSQ